MLRFVSVVFVTESDVTENGSACARVPTKKVRAQQSVNPPFSLRFEEDRSNACRLSNYHHTTEQYFLERCHLCRFSAYFSFFVPTKMSRAELSLSFRNQLDDYFRNRASRKKQRRRSCVIHSASHATIVCDSSDDSTSKKSHRYRFHLMVIVDTKRNPLLPTASSISFRTSKLQVYQGETITTS